jgi:hypothetical protein
MAQDRVFEGLDDGPPADPLDGADSAIGRLDDFSRIPRSGSSLASASALGVGAGLRLGERQTSDVMGDVTGETIPQDPLDTSGTDIDPTTGTGTDPFDGAAGDTGPQQRTEQAQDQLGSGSGAVAGVGLGELPSDVLDTGVSPFSDVDGDTAGRQDLGVEAGTRAATNVLAGVRGEQAQQLGQQQRLDTRQRLDQQLRQRVEAPGRVTPTTEQPGRATARIGTETPTTRRLPDIPDRPELDTLDEEERRANFGFGGQTFESPTQSLSEISEDINEMLGGDR